MSTSRKQWRWNNRSTWLTVVGLSFCLWFAWPYVSLLAAITFIASDSRHGDSRATGAVHGDDLRWLASYPPKHVLMFLRSPSAQVRAVACQALGAAEMVDANHDWSGVSVSLSKVAVNDENPQVRELAAYALRNGPQISSEDMPSILSLAGPELPIERRQVLISCVADKAGESREILRDWLLTLTASPLTEDKVFAVAMYAAHFPPEDSLFAVFREIIRSPRQFDSWWPEDVLRQLAEKKPSFVSELLEGDEAEAGMALRFLVQLHQECARRMATRTAGHGHAFGEPEEPKCLHCIVDDANIAQSASRAARSLLGHDGSGHRKAAIAYLGREETGIRSLLESCIRGETGHCMEVLAALEKFTWAVCRKSGDQFQFTAAEAEYLMGLLNSSDPQLRDSAAGVLGAGITSEVVRSNPFAEGVGPRDKNNRRIFADILSDPDNRLHWLALEYFNHITPYETEQIPDVVAAITHVRGQTQPALTAFHRLTEAFPEDERVRRAARQLLEMQTQCTQVTFAASRYLYQFAPHSVFSEVAQLFQTTDRQNQGPVMDLLIDFAFEQGGFREQSFAQHVWQSYLHCYLENPVDLRKVRLRQVRSLVGPEIAAAGLKYAMRDALQRGRGDLKLLDVFPEYSAVLTVVVRDFFTNGDSNGRICAADYVGQTLLSSDDQRELLATALDDADPRVAISALENLNKLKLHSAETLAVLRELATDAPNSALRAVAIEGLVATAPECPRTQKLVAQLVDVEDFQVRLTARHAQKVIDQWRLLAVK